MNLRPAWATSLRELRDRESMSQEAFAERIGVSVESVSRWERALNRPQAQQIATICRAFAVDVETLGFVGSDPMKRRDFVRVGAGLFGFGLAAALPFDLGLEAASRTGLAALLPAGISSDRHPAEHFLLIRKTLADNDNLFGPGQVIPKAIAQVEAMQRLRPRLRGSDLQELLRVQTQFADLIGWLHQDSGDFPAAQFWMDRALEWAHLAGDGDSVVFVLARKSQLAGDMRDSVAAVEVAEAAMQSAGPRSRLAAVAATYAAHGHALRGDRSESDRLYDQAGVLLQAADSEASPWGRFFDPAYIDVQRARSLAVLGDHGAAADGFRTAIEQLQPGYHRDRGVYLAREAVSRAGAGNAEHAATLGLQALVIGAETGSGRIAAELAQLNQALEPVSSAPDVTRFRAALAAASW